MYVDNWITKNIEKRGNFPINPEIYAFQTI